MILARLHLAPNAPWVVLLLVSLAFLGLAWWAYRFALPPLSQWTRRGLSLLRLLALAGLVWLLAQPVLERASGGREANVALLVDRSRSMDLPAGAGGVTRATTAEAAATTLRRAMRGRARVIEIPFASRIGGDSIGEGWRGATALGSVLAGLPNAPVGQDLDGIVVLSDGVVNAGDDPVAAARGLGLPVHTVVIGDAGVSDRAVTEVEAPPTARVGEPVGVRVRVTSSEPAGVPLTVRLLDGGRELARAPLRSPGPGVEGTADLRVTPVAPGLAVWRAEVDSLGGEITAANNARQVALDVAPGRLGVLIVSADLNWDLTFLRRALAADSGLAMDTRVRLAGGWTGLERRAGAPGPADLAARAVVVLDGLAPADLGPAFDGALAAFVRGGGGLLLFGGPAPGLARYARGGLASDLRLPEGGARRTATPAPAVEAREILAWDEDPARGDRAWRAAAPLTEVAAIQPGAGDRVLLGAADGGAPLVIVRRVGRGQVVFVNGSGTWRWSLSGFDELSTDRGQRLWRRVVRWLAQPVQAEPLRVRPQRWLSARGEAVTLIAGLQDGDFRPVAGAEVVGDIMDQSGRATPVRFTAREPGSYVAVLEDLPPGRFRVQARAVAGGRAVGQARTEFAVDRWSLEETRTEPDSATMAAVAAAAGGRIARADAGGRWTRDLDVRRVARGRSESVRLWESPWVFALVIGALGIEWAWRRQRGLP